jgi:hypothetical protein
MSKHDVESRLMGLAESLRSLGIQGIGLFGSTARGDAGPDSDIDLLIEFSEGKNTFTAFMDAADLLEAGFPVHVDVLTLQSFDPRRMSPYHQPDQWLGFAIFSVCRCQQTCLRAEHRD